MPPPHLRDISGWPKVLYPLLEEHGVSRVWSVGLATLGYPPTWEVVGQDVQRLAESLKQTNR